MSEWEELETWVTLACVKEVPPAPGVYAVRSMQGDKPKVIARAFGKDESGILCFGTTKRRTLRERLGQFCQAASGQPVPHSEGKRYHNLGYSCRRRYPLSSLRIAWRRLETQEEAEQREKDWFKEYERVFGELPPLNRRCG